MKENRRVRKMKRQIKELRQVVARAGNEICRRKYWRKTTYKEKRIIEVLKRKASSILNELKYLIMAKKHDKIN